ncbi:MAG: hypothetical protein JOZ17_11470, partial [Acetobacteraceae bacterium]|nr:hypothetical protein [Acetobacteraceae bacterium]
MVGAKWEQPTPEHRPVRWPTPRISLNAQVSIQAYCKNCSHVAALYQETIERLRGEYKRLDDRIHAMYVDKLDGKIGGDFYDRFASE